MSFELPEPEILQTAVQPEAAIAYWQWKSALPYDEVKKMEAGARQRAFYVSGLAEHDAVQTVKDALQQALNNGETLADFKVRIKDVIASQGWHNSRIETIFRNNMQTAYSAGRYAKMQQVKALRPFWQYYAIGDDRTRPAHAVLNGIVYSADHPFWAENYPPNGHKCRCGVRTLSARQVKAEGLTVQEKMPQNMMYINPQTKMEYPIARPGADDGFRNNPAKSWLNGLDLNKYKTVTPQSYTEQRLRPAPVKTYKDLGQEIKNRCGAFVRNSNAITHLQVTNKSFLMSTNSCGSLSVSNRTFPTSKGKFSPAVQLKNAWNKLAEGKKLDWLEEYSMESLWHELIHNQQQLGRGVGGKNTIARQLMEVATQWTARRTYPTFLQSLGGEASHLASIKKEGLGYGGLIRNFDKLLDVLKINEDSMLQEMLRLLDTMPRDTYAQELSNFLSKSSGQQQSAINKALKATAYGDTLFEDALKTLVSKK